MELKQSCNVFLSGRQYKDIKELGYRLNVPYSELMREGVGLVLRKYKRKENRKDRDHHDE